MDTEALRQEFEKFAAAEGEDEAKTLPVQHLTEVLGEIGLAELAAPKELAAFVKTVAANPMFLTFEETCVFLPEPYVRGYEFPCGALLTTAMVLVSCII